jgi:hypothetical protein
MHPVHSLNALLAEFLQSSLSDSVSLNELNKSSLLHSVHLLNALLAELYRTLRDSVFSVPPLHSLTSKVFNNLEVSP